MPVDRQVQLRYQVLNKCFRNRHREYTIDDLVVACNDALQKELDYPYAISKRTIQDDINKLQMPPYSIRLNEKLRSGRKRVYRYIDTNFTLPHYQLNDTERNKIQQAINVLKSFEGEPQYDWVRTCLMQIDGGIFSNEGRNIVSFQSNPDLKGIELFSELLKSIIYKHTIEITYKPFGQEENKKTVFPYFLKQYNDRWYLLLKERGYDSISICALDRIESFREIAINFEDTSIDFEEYFDDVVGVSVPNCNAENVILKVKKPRSLYIKTKPLHLSQRVINETDTEVIFSINVKPNRELEATILSFGQDIEILSPESLRKSIVSRIDKMYRNYFNNAENLHT